MPVSQAPAAKTKAEHPKRQTQEFNMLKHFQVNKSFLITNYQRGGGDVA
jgi:hypothetical protein